MKHTSLEYDTIYGLNFTVYVSKLVVSTSSVPPYVAR